MRDAVNCWLKINNDSIKVGTTGPSMYCKHSYLLDKPMRNNRLGAEASIM